MTAKRYTPDDIRQAEEAVRRIQGVSSCRIDTDNDGKIKKVDVVVTTTKSDKLVARDVESCLMAEMNMPVDYKKVNVVLFESSTAADRVSNDITRTTDSGEPISHFPLEEYGSRFAFQSVNVFQSQDDIQAEVELVRDGVETFGSAESGNLSTPHHRIVAEATLQAISELLDDEMRLCLSDVVEIKVGGEDAIVVKVDLLRNRESKSLAGCSLFSANTNQTTVFATLDAVNRVLGVMKSKDAVEYRIK
jgi:hypothetical protein